MSIQITRPIIGTWKGKKFDDLTEEELREALQWAAQEIDRLRSEKANQWPQRGIGIAQNWGKTIA